MERENTNRRNTVQKELVLKAVTNMRRHVTADEVYEQVKATHPNVGKGTVYRNLGILVEENKIRRVEVSDGPDRFDYKLKRHYHLRCVKCGDIIDVDMEEIPAIEEYMRSSQGPVFLDYDIFFKGICANCRDKERNLKKEDD